MTFHVPECYRIKTGPLASDAAYGNNGAFVVPYEEPLRPGGKTTVKLRIIASDGEQWEHVSVSLSDRCPIWPQMAYIKNLFWDAEDCVMQLHPPQSEYVNCHPFTLHLWRPIGQQIPMPPSILV